MPGCPPELCSESFLSPPPKIFGSWRSEAYPHPDPGLERLELLEGQDEIVSLRAHAHPVVLHALDHINWYEERIQSVSTPTFQPLANCKLDNPLKFEDLRVAGPFGRPARALLYLLRRAERGLTPDPGNYYG